MKRNSTNYWIYLGMMTVFCALIYFALCTGQHIDHSEVSSTVNTEMSSFELFKRIISDNLTNSLTILLLQIIVILITVRIFSFLFKYIGQPGVMGEIRPSYFRDDQFVPSEDGDRSLCDRILVASGEKQPGDGRSGNQGADL